MSTKTITYATLAGSLIASSAGTAVAIPPAVYGGPSQISGAAPGPTFNFGANVPMGEVDPQAAATLASSINTALAGLPADASQADIEAAIVFAIDQSNQSMATVLAALGQVSTSGLSGKALAALGNVRTVRGRLQRGTGAIALTTDTSLLAFGPDLSVNGGSSDYAR